MKEISTQLSYLFHFILKSYYGNSFSDYYAHAGASYVLKNHLLCKYTKLNLMSVMGWVLNFYSSDCGYISNKSGCQCRQNSALTYRFQRDSCLTIWALFLLTELMIFFLLL